MPTFMLTHWTRDRTRGPKLPLEYVIQDNLGNRQEFGLLDRGVLQPGYRADVNLINYDGLSLSKPELVWDPAGGRRLIQRPEG